MRLVKAEVSGFGRLAAGKVNLDNKVLAIVGPNEAGKTTLLRALAFIDNRAVLSPAERSRGLEIADNHTVVKVQYLLDETDLAVVADLDLLEAPTSIWLSRNAADAAEPTVTVVPKPQKATGSLIKQVGALRQLVNSQFFDALNYIEQAPDENGELPPEDDDRVSLRATVEAAVNDFLEGAQGSNEPQASYDHAEELRNAAELLSNYGLASDLVGLLRAILEWTDRADPGPAAATALYEISPNIEFFDDADRTLASTYVLSEELLANVPAALNNLAVMAGLDLRAVWRAMSTGDEGERETLIDAANQILATKFAAAWKQSNITVWLKTESTTLFIRIKQDDKRITQFSERSAGLQMFVALVAFLAVRGETEPPILLIDEAETHLHIDAQADLVNTFMTQQQAAKIIYTTHSPACLPPDLGSNIRAVLPDPSNQGQSLIQGSFWHGAAGFSPLMLAMGAGAAAFSAARYVVLGEGASEMLMLPSLIKAATDTLDLEYQVAPGLSEAPTEMYPELDLEGARVAFLVDSDQGGQDRRAALIEGGVPEGRIAELGALTLENLLQPDLYLETVRVLLGECNPGVAIPDLPELPDPTVAVWPNELDRWAEQHELKMPGKRVVASRLVEEGRARPSNFGAPILRALHSELQAMLRERGGVSS